MPRGTRSGTAVAARGCQDLKFGLVMPKGTCVGTWPVWVESSFPRRGAQAWPEPPFLPL